MSDEVRILKLTKKKKNYIITTDEKEYIFDEDTIVEFGLFKDKVFSKTQFKEILKKRDANNSFNLALKYLSISIKSQNEVEKYLEKKDINKSIINKTIIRLRQFGYLDDKTYALKLLQYYQSSNKGPQFISKKLYDKKIDRKIIESTMASFTEDIEKAIINKTLAKEANKYKEYPILKQRQVLSDKLIRNGFTPSLVFSIIREYDLIDESHNKLLLDIEKQKRLLANKDLTDSQKKQKIMQSLVSKGYDYHKISSLLE